jgi:hypothetical protein
MRWIAESLAEQAFGRRGIAQRRQQEVDGGTRGIDGPIQVAPSALHSNIRLIDTPGFVGRLEMTAQPLFQFGTVTLHPTPDRRVIRFQTALGEQFFDVAERKRVPQIPAHRTKNQLRRRLPPLEDCRSGCVLHGRLSLSATPAKVATHPARLYSSAIAGVKSEGTLHRRFRHRPVQYLNNILEQDHRAIKRRVKAKQSFREFRAAGRTIAGYEAIHMIRKGQARWVSDGDVRQQNWFIDRLLDLAA